MSLEPEKVAITRETIKRYRRYKRLSHPIVWLLRVVIWLGMTVGMAIIIWTGVRDENVVGGFFIAISSIGIFGFVMFALTALILQPHREGAFFLLDRWKSISRRPIEEFPFSESHLRAYEGWATRTLWERAASANLAFERQRVIREESKDKDYSHASTTDITRIVEYYESAISNADKLAKERQQSFLDFWDLVTGLGILKGTEWQDPEGFRQTVCIAEGKRL